MKSMKNRIIFLLFLLLHFYNANGFWEKVTNMPSLYQTSYWLDVYFLESNPQYGWSCGYEGKVIRTTDGGDSWLGTQIVTANQLESIHFVSSTHGYCSGEGKIYKSTDGGATWRDISPDTYDVLLWCTYFLDENNGYVIGGDCRGHQRFFRTTNGGNSWSDFYAFYPGSKLADCLFEKGTGIGYAVGSGLIWKTNNFGTTWQVHSRTGGFDWHEEIARFGKSFLVPYSIGCDGTMQDVGGVRFSTNDGATWRNYTAAGSMFGTFLIDSLRGWACGTNRSVYYTSDGGQTWEMRNCGVDPNASLDDIWFVDDTTGWLAGEGLYRLRKNSIPSPTIVALGNTEVCKGDSVTLTLEGTYRDILWSNGKRTQSITVGSSGKYSVFVSNSECEYAYSNEIEVIVRDSVLITVESSDSSPCVGDTVELKVVSPYSSANWLSSTGDEILLVSENGTYRVYVVDDFGCKDSLDVNVRFNDLPTPNINALTRVNICVGDTVVLQVAGNYPSVQWWNGDKSLEQSGMRLRIGESGDYHVKVTDANGCVGTSDTINVIVRDETNRLALQLEVGTNEFFIDSTSYSRIACCDLFIRNVGNETAIIADPYLFYKLSFSIPQSQLPISIAPGEQKSLAICYSPRSLLFERDTLVVEDICNDHYLPIVAFGSPNSYAGSSHCDIDLLLKTVKIGSGTTFVTASPYPNPASRQAAVPIAMFKPSGSSDYPAAELYDILGNMIGQGIFQIDASENLSEGVAESGTIIFDVGQITRGIYIIKVSTTSKIDVYKLVIE